jgi:soluble lytic murein transglycosylase-like protein
VLPFLALAVVVIIFFGSQLQAQTITIPGIRLRELKQGIPFRSLIMQEATKRGLDPCLVAGIIEVESSFNPDASNPADPSFGLMQITPIALKDTQERGNISPAIIFQQLRNPEINVAVGTEFLKILRDRHNINFPDEVDAFNAGPDLNPRVPEYVERVKAAMRNLCA